jgi:nucleosome binding factor SPN SPT16 subunit
MQRSKPVRNPEAKQYWAKYAACSFPSAIFSRFTVYPNKTKEMLAKSSVAELMDAPEVKAVLGTTKRMQKAGSKAFYNALQYYVDSKEKATGQPDKKDVRGKKTMEFWPLIKVVRIYTKADVLSTGAVIVDLPGVQDSNAARAAVAASYMKQCTGKVFAVFRDMQTNGLKGYGLWPP